MKKTAVVLLVILVTAGCSHARIDASVGTGASTVTPAAGSTVTSGSAGLHIQSRSLAAVVIAGMFMAAAIEDAREPRPFPSFSVFSDWFRGTPALELSPHRSINEQDCTRPVEFTGNLKCR